MVLNAEANTLKCNKCNIVICEILAFIQNKIEVMDDESLVRICLSGFSAEDLETAKLLLFSSVPSSNKRRVNRKGAGKSNRDIEDIIAFLKETDPEKVPIFVARDLNKLPPISFDHVDVTRLLKDILILKSEVKNIKETYVTAEHLTQEIKLIELLCNKNCDQNVNNYCGGYMQDSGPVALPHTPCGPQAPPCTTGSRKTGCELSVSSAQRTKQAAIESPSVSGEFTASSSQNKTIVTPITYDEEIKNNLTKMTMADVLRKEGSWKVNTPTEEWKTVQRKRLRNKFIGQKGCANTQPQEKFRAADIKVPVYISNVHLDTQESDIKRYIEDKTKENVSLEKIVMKYSKGYSSYKLYVSKQKLELFLNDKLWPDGISFRRFNYLHRYRDKGVLSNNQYENYNNK